MTENSPVVPAQTFDLSAVLGFNEKMHGIRVDIVEKGIFHNDATNSYDNYKYLSEAFYKKEANGLFTKHRIEFRASEVSHEILQGTEKQPFAVLVTYEFCLKDIDTGYMEVTYHSGIGMDKGDKAIYKARTGAFKSFMANNFLFPTTDDPEMDDEIPEKKTIVKKAPSGTITTGQVALIKSLFKNSKEELKTLMTPLNKKKIEELSVEEASKIIDSKKGEPSNEWFNSRRE